MTTRRDALVAAGLAKPGRGKFSTEANAWLDAQRAAGVTFSDDNAPVKPVKSRVVKSVTEKSEKPVVKTENGVGYPDYIFPSDYRFPEEDYRAFKRVNGKKVSVGMREVCNNCRVSLVNHGCDSPTIHGSISVTIERMVVASTDSKSP